MPLKIDFNLGNRTLKDMSLDAFKNFIDEQLFAHLKEVLIAYNSKDPMLAYVSEGNMLEEFRTRANETWKRVNTYLYGVFNIHILSNNKVLITFAK